MILWCPHGEMSICVSETWRLFESGKLLGCILKTIVAPHHLWNTMSGKDKTWELQWLQFDNFWIAWKVIHHHQGSALGSFRTGWWLCHPFTYWQCRFTNHNRSTLNSVGLIMPKHARKPHPDIWLLGYFFVEGIGWWQPQVVRTITSPSPCWNNRATWELLVLPITTK